MESPLPDAVIEKDFWVYTKTPSMLHKDIPLFNDLMSFAEKLEQEFNNWVKRH